MLSHDVDFQCPLLFLVCTVHINVGHCSLYSLIFITDIYTITNAIYYSAGLEHTLPQELLSQSLTQRLRDDDTIITDDLQ